MSWDLTVSERARSRVRWMRAGVLARPSARSASFFSSDVGADVTSLRTVSYYGIG
jgi:hypothetical protein